METDQKMGRVRDVLGKYRYVLLILLAGVVLLAWPSGAARPGTDAASGGRESGLYTETLKETEERMQNILSRIDGVGQLELMLSVESMEQREFAVDTELSYSGQTTAPDNYTRRSETVIVSESGKDSPVVARSISPTYRGALVVCQGGGNSEVKLAVTQAVAALTGLSSDRITVVQWQS